MVATPWAWDGISFTRVGSVELFADDLFPELRYAKKAVVKLLPNGGGPYCKFQVPGLPSTSGVYAFFVRGALQYVGKAEVLKRRLYHYGNISPKNCYVGGRVTNIRLNKLVREALFAGDDVEIFIYETTDFSVLEDRMVWHCSRRGTCVALGLRI